MAQVDPEQQPEAQFALVQPLQMPALQTPGWHDWQGAPPLPQAVSEAPVWHVVPAQQPEQEDGSQTQEPLEQRCPAAQGEPPPH